MSYLEELLPEFRKGAKIMRTSETKNLGIQPYYFFKDDKIWYNDGVSDKNFNDRPFTTNELMADDWELYKEPQPDWDYIIENKCLCWFWDYNESNKILGFLIKLNENKTLCRFTCQRSGGDTYDYALCRPVTKDEIAFYEDNKDK